MTSKDSNYFQHYILWRYEAYEGWHHTIEGSLNEVVEYRNKNTNTYYRSEDYVITSSEIIVPYPVE